VEQRPGWGEHVLHKLFNLQQCNYVDTSICDVLIISPKCIIWVSGRYIKLVHSRLYTNKLTYTYLVR
jgi:hypothetical protein